MRILVLGNGAREHAICSALSRSKKNPEIFSFASAKNPGIYQLAKKMKIADLFDFAELKRFANFHKIDFAVLGPDDPIAAGAADALAEIGIPSIGPTKKLAQIESSKSYTRDLLEKYGIKGNPKFEIFTRSNFSNAKTFAHKCGEIVVKFDGLAGGKGVQVQGDHFKNVNEGLEYAQECIEKSGKVVIEEKLVGQEFSLLFFVDGNSAIPMPVVQDNKRALENDCGPNTGGMGTISDSNFLLPFLTEKDLREATEISEKTIDALQHESEQKYCGILFGGFIATKKGVRLIEFNARFGDPESLNILSILKTDFCEICEKMIAGKIADIKVEFQKKATVCKYVVPKGYPENPEKNSEIKIDFHNIPKNCQLFFGSVYEKEKKFFLSGSRAIGLVGIADSIYEAEKIAELSTSNISGNVFHRSDIGTEKFITQKIIMMESLRN